LRVISHEHPSGEKSRTGIRPPKCGRISPHFVAEYVARWRQQTYVRNYRWQRAFGNPRRGALICRCTYTANRAAPYSEFIARLGRRFDPPRSFPQIAPVVSASSPRLPKLPTSRKGLARIGCLEVTHRADCAILSFGDAKRRGATPVVAHWYWSGIGPLGHAKSSDSG
jgi:hypothetical protein